MVYLLHTLFFFPLYIIVRAGNLTKGSPCSQSQSRLQIGTYQFWDQCDSRTYCSADGVCALKKCRKDDFPFGYQPGDNFPPKCRTGEFCPDEEDACQPVLAVGSSCQLNRDDQCQGPPNFKLLADTSGRGTNRNGSVCLNNVCMWANASLGNTCVVENTAYIAYEPGGEFLDIVSRGNCQHGLYCDSQTLICKTERAAGEPCSADKECSSWNCLSAGVCGVSTSVPHHFAPWVYVLVSFGILGGMFGTLFALYFAHRKQRDEEREKRLQYWREQNAFHQNLLQMRETARASMLSLPLHGHSDRTVIYDDGNSLTSNNFGPKTGLRHDAIDDTSFEDDYCRPGNTRNGRF